MDQRHQTLLILGASGDLTERYLLPSLGRLLRDEPGRRVTLIGSSRRENERWSDVVAQSFAGYSGPAVDATVADTRWVAADVTSAGDWDRLLGDVTGQAVVYFALGPEVTRKACEALREVELPSGTRLVLEKPFGQDADSAADLNDLVAGLVGADHVFRVDHFLATAAVRSIRALRFGNRAVEAIWNNRCVSELAVVWEESLGLAGRADFYDGTGALRDMIQSHLLHVLAAAIAPVDPGDGGDPRSLALRSLRLADGPAAVRRARWTAGEISGEPVEAYADHEGVDPDRRTETLAQVVMTSDLPDWRGVPLRLRSGKGLGADRRLVEVTLRHPEPGAHGLRREPPPGRLGIDILTGAVTWSLTGADPDDPAEPEPLVLEGAAGPQDVRAADAATYARVLRAALDGDQSLSVSAADAVQCWRLVAPALAKFARDEVPLEEYPAGSEGPR